MLGESTDKERRTTGKVGECRRNPVKMRRIYATPRLGEELLEKMGILEKTPEKKVESPREKGEQKRWKLQKGELRLTIKNKQEIKTYSELVEKVGDN